VSKYQVVVLRVPAPDAESGSLPARWDWTVLADTTEPVEVLAAGPVVEVEEGDDE
jgi:hypothetical protein